MTVHKLRARLESSEGTIPGHFFSSIRAASMPVVILTMMTLFMLVILPLFAGTKILHRWVLTGQPMPQLKKILVIAVVENYLIRQHFEDEMERVAGQCRCCWRQKPHGSSSA